MNLESIETLSEACDHVKDTVIVALDLPTQREALELVDTLKDRIRYFKIGHRLFSRFGPQILEECARRDVEVFLDLKLYDIPSVVGDACTHIASHDSVFMTTVHASGGDEMLRAAVEGASAEGPGNRPYVVAVTALTSFSKAALPEIGVGLSMSEWAARLGDLALQAGVDGLVSSTLEVPGFRSEYGTEPILVTPGIRLPDVAIAGDDQQRIATPFAALAAGSTMLVMGRPIYQAPDPVAVIDVIAESILNANESEGQS